MRDKTFMITLIITIWVLALAQIALTLTHRKITIENEAYNIFQACALSVTADERSDERIEDCWEQAEMLTGLNIKRFDK